MKIENKGKIIAFICILSIMVTGVIIYYEYKSNSVINEYRVEKGLRHNGELKYEINKEELNDGYIHIEGYAYIEGENMEYIDQSIILKDCSNGKYYKVKTEFRKRTDVTVKVGDRYNYDNSGFETRIFKKKLRADDKYKICILYKTKTEKLLYETKDYI